MKLASYQRKMTRYYNSRLKKKLFWRGDLVLRRIFLSSKEPNVGILCPNWAPYRILEELRPDTYSIEMEMHNPIPRMLNIYELLPASTTHLSSWMSFPSLCNYSINEDTFYICELIPVWILSMNISNIMEEFFARKSHSLAKNIIHLEMKSIKHPFGVNLETYETNPLPWIHQISWRMSLHERANPLQRTSFASKEKTWAL